MGEVPRTFWEDLAKDLEDRELYDAYAATWAEMAYEGEDDG